MIGVIDYGAGNLMSVIHAVEYEGYEVVIVKNKNQAEMCRGLILPGVGSYKEAINQLKIDNWDKIIENHISNDKKLMGICLGMQLLFETGEEDGLSKGLGLIKGKVVKFPKGTVRVPHMGWNSVEWKVRHKCNENIKSGIDFYHVHSYYCKPYDSSNILASCKYGIEFTTAIISDNIVGYQFHPEKSQPAGPELIRNFCEWTEC